MDDKKHIVWIFNSIFTPGQNDVADFFENSRSKDFQMQEI
jgi:hypothetical protein